MALWNEQTSEQRFFTDAFDRDVMQQSIRIGGAAINMQPWFRTVPARYQPHTAAIAERVYNAAIGKMLTTRLALALANELHDMLWTELVPIRAADDPVVRRRMGESDAALRARLIEFTAPAMGSRRALEKLLDQVVIPNDARLELIANATEPAIIRVAVTPPDQRIETAIGYYLKPHVAAGVGLFVDGGPVWELPKTLHEFVKRMAKSMGMPTPNKVIADMVNGTIRMPLRALTAEQLEEVAVECDRMLRDGQEREGQPAEYWARAVVGEQRRREAL